MRILLIEHSKVPHPKHVGLLVNARVKKLRRMDSRLGRVWACKGLGQPLQRTWAGEQSLRRELVGLKA